MTAFGDIASLGDYSMALEVVRSADARMVPPHLGHPHDQVTEPKTLEQSVEFTAPGLLRRPRKPSSTFPRIREVLQTARRSHQGRATTSARRASQVRAPTWRANSPMEREPGAYADIAIPTSARNTAVSKNGTIVRRTAVMSQWDRSVSRSRWYSA